MLINPLKSLGYRYINSFHHKLVSEMFQHTVYEDQEAILAAFDSYITKINRLCIATYLLLNQEPDSEIK